MYYKYLNKQRWLSCLYMLCFSIISTCLALSALSSIGLSQLLPIKQSLLLSSFLGVSIGLIKFRTLTNYQLSNKRAFFIGMGLFILLLPLFDIGALFMIQNQFHGTDAFHSQLTEYFTLYLVILIYSFMFIGSWLSLVCGLMFLMFNQLVLKSIRMLPSSMTTSV